MTHECLTHHDACPCQEAEHKFQIEQRDKEIERLRVVVLAIEQRAANNLNDRETVYAVYAMAKAALMPNAGLGRVGR